ncbi:MAG: polysaccharide biosynthesis tyrosine autokinase [Prevotella sp.]|jgi:capsular exopolysaccharide synthesis family protein|nr:polysaccharide biosynthesis tyrosine autokinase [Prevotella sp.]
MEENKIQEQDVMQQIEQDAVPTFSFQTIYKALVLNWQWVLLSLIICLGLAAIYLRYSAPTYQAFAKVLIKEEENKNRYRGNAIQNMSDMGLMVTSSGFDNEMEILQSSELAADVVRDMKLYVTYRSQGRVMSPILYKTQPLDVDIDAAHVEKIKMPINMEIEKEDGVYQVTGSYYVTISENEVDGPFTLNKTFKTLPAQIPTRAGLITIAPHEGKTMKEGEVLKINIVSPKMIAMKYVNSLTVEPTSKTTTIAQLKLIDEVPDRALDYLQQLITVYNRQANEDKNEIALRTEKFINNRLEKINNELGATESQLQSYKQRNGMVDLKANAQKSMTSENEFDKKLADANTQIDLFNEISSYMNQPGNRYQVIPSNIGLNDPSTTNLINQYNTVVQERNRLLRSASENSPVVEPLTDQLNSLNNSIRKAISQGKRGLEIQRNAVSSQYQKYASEIAETPEQERMLTQIGRQQEVKSGLYLMLLQKREENSISLAATADKGRLIDKPLYGGIVSPKKGIIMLVGLIAGLLLPALIIYLLSFFRYKIEGHEDVEKLTKLPILADVAVASETAKTRADIVVHENQNNQMEEIFRSMRTNLQFTLEEGERVIMFTSSTSGEGKTFNCANLAVSFALLGKKVILMGLDIRKPRLAELFEINSHQLGITPLLTKDADQLTIEQVKANILPSEVQNNLDLLLAGPIPPNPAELLARPALDRIVELLKQEYDYILIDTAPVGLVTDTLAIARVADATVYMCRADYTPKESFGLINSLANEKKMPKMSIVINGIDMSKRKYGYYYGYGRYGKYGRYGRYGRYTSYSGKYGKYGTYGYGYGYGGYGSYGRYSNSHYGNKNDTSIKL